MKYLKPTLTSHLGPDFLHSQNSGKPKYPSWLILVPILAWIIILLSGITFGALSFLEGDLAKKTTLLTTENASMASQAESMEGRILTEQERLAGIKLWNYWLGINICNSDVILHVVRNLPPKTILNRLYLVNEGNRSIKVSLGLAQEAKSLSSSIQSAFKSLENIGFVSTSFGQQAGTTGEITFTSSLKKIEPTKNIENGKGDIK